MWSTHSGSDVHRQSQSGSVPPRRMPYPPLNASQPQAPGSMFDPAMIAASPSGISQPPTPMLEPSISTSSSFSSSRHSLSSAPADPMMRFLGQRHEGPFNLAHISSPVIPSDHDSMPASSVSFMQMQPSVRSDSASVVTGLPPNDSAYFTAPKAYSTGSADPSLLDQDCADVMSPFESLRTFHTPPSKPVHSPTPTSAPRSGPIAASSGDRGDLSCPHCAKKLRLKSELKKHILRHERPFKCDDPTCSRSKQGFTTPNDLDRHKRSKHKIFPASAKVYICASPNCAEGGKAWPRYDNFKQHVDRMHKMEDTHSLLERSEQPASATANMDFVTGSDTATQGGTDFKDSRSGRGLDSLHDDLSHIHAFAGDMDQASPYDDVNLYADPALNAARSAQSYSEDVSEPNSLLDHSFDPYDPQVGQLEHPTYATFGDGQFDDSHNFDGVMGESDDANMIHFEQTGAPSRQSGKGPAIVVHHSQVPRQRQNEDLAHMLAAGLASKPQSESPYATLNRVLKEAEMNDYKMGVKQAMRSAPPASRNRPLFRGLGGIKAGKVYKANSTSGGRVQVTVAQGSGTSDRGARGSTVGGAVCPKCKKILPRQCDLKKHERRHTRPFGCTFDQCHKQFGSKNDWKRHESSQHFQDELWRCDMPQKGGGEGQACAKLFYTADSFAAHLRKTHSVEGVQLEHLRASQRIGRNHQRSFWCGFCRGIQTLTRVGRKAWDERFDHIGDHFLQDNRRIQEWVSLGGDKTKGELRAENELGWTFTAVEDDKTSGDGDGDVSQRESTDEAASTRMEAEDGRELRQERQASLQVEHYCDLCSDGPYSSMVDVCSGCGGKDCLQPRRE